MMDSQYSSVASTQWYPRGDCQASDCRPARGDSYIAGTRVHELEGLKVPCPVKVFSGARNALYQRNTPGEWHAHNQLVALDNDNACQNGERARFETLRLGRETYQTGELAANDADRKLDDRIGDVKHWKSQLDTEADAMTHDMEHLEAVNRAAVKLLHFTEEPLHVAQECVHQREKRQDMELVHDVTEKNLLQEIQIIIGCQDALRGAIAEMGNQMKVNLEIQKRTQDDIRDKYAALKLDESCGQLRTHSESVARHRGIERTDNCVSDPVTWAESSHVNLQRSQRARHDTSQLEEQVERLMNECKNKMVTQWVRVQEAFNLRIQETTEAMEKIHVHLSRNQQEIFDLGKTIDYLKKCLNDTEAPRALAETRLEIRRHRPNMEACKDPAQIRIVEQVDIINMNQEQMRNQLWQCEETLQQLHNKKAALEHELKVKKISLHIDREKCLGIHRGYLFQ